MRDADVIIHNNSVIGRVHFAWLSEEAEFRPPGV